MPTLQESLQAAKDSQGAPAGRPSKRLRPFGAASSQSTADDLSAMMLRSLRLSSQLADKVEGAVAATNLVVIVNDPKYKETIHSTIQNWLQMKPDYDSNVAKQPEHPWGEKKLFVFATVMEVLSGEFKESETAQAISDLQQFQTEELARWVAACRPGFAQPKENRPWVLELSLSTLSPEKFRAACDLISAQCRSDKIRVEPQKWAQSQLQRQVWDDIKRLQGQASQ